MDAVAGNSPIIVNRETGELESTGTARPTEEYLAEYIESRRRIREGWPVELDERLRDLLILVRDHASGRTTRIHSHYLGRKHPARPERTLLDELEELERRQMVSRRDAADSGEVWMITDRGRAALG